MELKCFLFYLFFFWVFFFTVNWAMIIIMLFILVCFMSDLYKVQVIFSFKIWESVGLSHNIEGYDREHWS